MEPGSRTRPDGEVVAWRGAGIDDPDRRLDRPFFIAWDVPASLHPGATVSAQPCGATGIAAVEVSGDEVGLTAWLGGTVLPIETIPGEPGVLAVRLATPDGERRIAGD